MRSCVASIVKSHHHEVGQKKKCRPSISRGCQAHILLIVERTIGPRHGMLVVAVVNGEMCVRRLNRKHDYRNIYFTA